MMLLVKKQRQAKKIRPKDKGLATQPNPTQSSLSSLKVIITMLSLSKWIRPGLQVAGKRYMSFSFAGPRTLNEIMKKEMVEDKKGNEVSDIWFSYHDSKDGVIGMSLKGSDGTKIVDRARSCPFFVHPIFRDDGFFNLISQFQGPSHFLMAYLEDYKMDPHSATPLITFSVFNDYAKSKDVSLVRCDILNEGINGDEGRRVVEGILEHYRNDDDFVSVETFNHRPSEFDFDDHVSRMNDRWKNEQGTVNME